MYNIRSPSESKEKFIAVWNEGIQSLNLSILFPHPSKYA
jgi:hypothetical protein